MLKKKIISALTLCILSATVPTLAIAEEPVKSTPAIVAPLWSELCPGYCSSSNRDVPEALPHTGLRLIIFAGFVPIFIPLVAIKEHKANQRDLEIRKALSQNYWVQRRGLFETEIAQCKQIQENDKLVDCYMNVRQLETTKNQARRQEMLMMDQVQALYSLKVRSH
jgi:hypothetical protein